MKHHITEEQFNGLSDKEKFIADSYDRRQSGPKPKAPEFWSIGRMIEFLNEYAYSEELTMPGAKGAWIDIYGCNLSATPLEQWCDRLWEKMKRVLSHEATRYPFTI